MKIEIHPTITHSTDERGLYNEILIQLEKNLRSNWILKPIRDLYRECLKRSSLRKEGYQPYALIKHTCGHRTVDVILTNRTEKKDTFIQYLRHQRKNICPVCSQNYLTDQEEKARAAYFTPGHLYEHLISFIKRTFMSKNDILYCDTCHFGAPHWKENREIKKADKEIDEMEKSQEEREKYKHYCSGSEF